MKESKGIWNKFFPCDCGDEGIMISYEMEEDGMPSIDLAFFGYGHQDKTLDLKSRIRFCWKVLTTGRPWADEVIMNSKTAGELGKELILFSKKYEKKTP